MFELILLLVISFFTGVFTKLVDLIEDNDLRLFKYDKFIFAIIYGLLIGYVISNYNLIASLWIGTIFALILVKKIDTKAHVIGLISTLIFVIVFGLGKINILFLIIFLIAAFLDEILSDFAEKSIKNGSIFNTRKNSKNFLCPKNSKGIFMKIKINKNTRKFKNKFSGVNKVFHTSLTIKKILELRILLEITALIISFIIWNFSLFIAILFFDIGYNLTNKIGLRLKK